MGINHLKTEYGVADIIELVAADLGATPAAVKQSKNLLQQFIRRRLKEIGQKKNGRYVTTYRRARYLIAEERQYFADTLLDPARARQVILQHEAAEAALDDIKQNNDLQQASMARWLHEEHEIDWDSPATELAPSAGTMLDDRTVEALMLKSLFWHFFPKFDLDALKSDYAELRDLSRRLAVMGHDSKSAAARAEDTDEQIRLVMRQKDLASRIEPALSGRDLSAYISTKNSGGGRRGTRVDRRPLG